MIEALKAFAHAHPVITGLVVAGVGGTVLALAILTFIWWSLREPPDGDDE